MIHAVCYLQKDFLEGRRVDREGVDPKGMSILLQLLQEVREGAHVARRQSVRDLPSTCRDERGRLDETVNDRVDGVGVDMRLDRHDNVVAHAKTRLEEDAAAAAPH